MKLNCFKSLLFLAVAIGISMTSCNKDNAKIDEKENLEGLVAFSPIISLGSSPIDARSATDPTDPTETDPGNTGEKMVSSVRVVLYDTDATGTLRYSWDLGVYVSGSGSVFTGPDVVNTNSAPTATSFQMKAQMVDEQDYHMLVLVNPSREVLDATEAGKNKSKTDFETAYTNNGTSEGLTKLIGQEYGFCSTTSTSKYKFFMTNFKGYLLVEESDLYPTAEDAENAPVGPIEVERAVAKVMVDYDNSIPTTSGASTGKGYYVTDVKWQLDVTNKTTYWMRKLAPIAGGDGDPKVIEGPNHTNRAYLYAEDPNFFNGTGVNDTQFNYYTTTGTNNPTFPNSWGTNNWEYAMENTMAAARQNQTETTRVIIRANYVPEKTAEGGSIIAGDGYYRFKGWFISQTEMSSYIRTSNPAPIPDELGDLDYAIEKIGNTHDLSGPAASFNAHGLTYYKGGISYYSILIRHFDDNLESNIMGYGRYGIVRNNLYQVKINGFSGPGDPDIDEPDDKDDEDYEYWVSAEIKVLPWYVRNQGADL